MYWVLPVLTPPPKVLEKTTASEPFDINEIRHIPATPSLLLRHFGHPGPTSEKNHCWNEQGDVVMEETGAQGGQVTLGRKKLPGYPCPRIEAPPLWLPCPAPCIPRPPGALSPPGTSAGRHSFPGPALCLEVQTPLPQLPRSPCTPHPLLPPCIALPCHAFLG